MQYILFDHIRLLYFCHIKSSSHIELYLIYLLVTNLFTFQLLVIELVDAIENTSVVGDVDKPVSMYTNPENKTFISFDREKNCIFNFGQHNHILTVSLKNNNTNFYEMIPLKTQNTMGGCFQKLLLKIVN